MLGGGGGFEFTFKAISTAASTDTTNCLYFPWFHSPQERARIDHPVS